MVGEKLVRFDVLRMDVLGLVLSFAIKQLISIQQGHSVSGETIIVLALCVC